MKIFYRRPLASLIFIALLGLLSYSHGEIWLRIASFAAIPLLFVFSFIFKSKRTMLILSSCVLLISMLCSAFYFDFWFYPHKLYKDEVEITAKVEEISRTSYSYRAYIKTTSIDSSKLHRHEMIVYLDKDSADLSGYLNLILV